MMREESDDQIEVDTNSSESGPYGKIRTRSDLTDSVRTSAMAYPIENGRRYHAFRCGIYCMPNDEPEQERLDVMHILVTKVLDGKLYLAPIDLTKANRVLDIGTGTGVWSMAIGLEFPNVRVLGVDLSAIQPLWVPSNVDFIVDDVESPWVDETKHDYVFCRYMAGCIKDWPKLIESIHENLEPGGWAEFQDFDLHYYSQDGTLKDDANLAYWHKTLVDAVRGMGAEPSPGPKLEEWVKAAGFVNVRHFRFSLPIGGWPKDRRLKEIGMFNLHQILSGLEAYSLRIYNQVLNWEVDAIHDLLRKVEHDLMNRKLHTQYDLHIVYGQKKSEDHEDVAER